MILSQQKIMGSNMKMAMMIIYGNFGHLNFNPLILKTLIKKIHNSLKKLMSKKSQSDLFIIFLIIHY